MVGAHSSGTLDRPWSQFKKRKEKKRNGAMKYKLASCAISHKVCWVQTSCSRLFSSLSSPWAPKPFYLHNCFLFLQSYPPPTWLRPWLLSLFHLLCDCLLLSPLLSLLVVGGAALPLASVVHARRADGAGDEVGGARGHKVGHCRRDVHPLVCHQVICRTQAKNK